MIPRDVTDVGAGLEQAFRTPPDSAKPWAYWWWLDGAASAAGITADLEALQAQGIGAVLLMDAGLGGRDAPQGPPFMSEEWRVNFRHAVREAARVGLQLTVNLCSGWNAGGPWVPRELAVKDLVWQETVVEGGTVIDREVPRYRPAPVDPPSAASRLDSGFPVVVTDPVDWYRDIAVLACREQDGAWSLDGIVDLTGSLEGDRLRWDCPPGRWTILRIGYVVQPFTPEGYRQVQLSSWPIPQWEIDPMDPAAMDLHFAETALKLIEDAGPLTGTTFTHTHIDSWEIGVPTWTGRFIEEFRARRGYDPTRYLPALAGKRLDTPDVTARFTWDYRRTVADLVTQNYYGRLAELSARHGLGIHPESGGPYYDHYIDALEVLGVSTVPMAEFWASRGPVRDAEGNPRGTTQGVASDLFRSSAASMPEQFGASVRQAATAGHIYGKPVVQAESFTNFNNDWSEDPDFLKPYGDRAFCMGLTRAVLCYSVHQSSMTDVPGYEWEHVGTHFDRNVTWWSKSGAWLTYLARCQHLLRQGHFAADILYFAGQAIPNFVLLDRKTVPGFDQDVVNADALLTRSQVRDGRLVLKDGPSYRYLVLPDGAADQVSPDVLDAIRSLVEAGATVVGRRPSRSLGLADHPASQAEVERLARLLWGEEGEAGTRQVGLGRVIPDATIEEVIARDGLRPDLEFRGVPDGLEIDWIHRAADGLDIYFLANLGEGAGEAEAVFRVSGRAPELWDPVSGGIRPLPDHRSEDGRTVVPLGFAAHQSWFVVFRRPATEGSVVRGPNLPRMTHVAELGGPWEVTFDPRWGGPGQVVFETLQDWTTRPEEGIRYYSGTATYRLTFDAPDVTVTHLVLGTVRNLAQVRLNGRDLGIVWTAPWHVRVDGALRARANELEIEVVNLWPNRLIGDGALPASERLTRTNVRTYERELPASFPCWWDPECEERKTTGAPPSLLSSGLLGPVRLVAAE